MFQLDRRTLLKMSIGLGISSGVANQAAAREPIYLGDMHRHLWFSRLQSGEARPMGQVIADDKATLVAWALGADAPWITLGPRKYVQKSVPMPGQSFAWFKRDLARIKQHIVEQKLKAWRPDVDWQVWNLAVPGYNTSQEL